MSLFLGKIHYWLFDKILWFEGLEDDIIKLAQKEGLNIDEIKNEIDSRHLWIKSFVNEVNGDFKYIQKNEIEYCISKRK